MNLGIVISYIIAGMILLGIAMMNINVQNSSAELTIAQITRSHVANIADMINDDFPNIGYHVNMSTSQIDTLDNKVLTNARSNEISFYRNLTEDVNQAPSKITWRISNDEIAGAKNLNHRTLYRIVENLETGEVDTTPIRTGVTRFYLRYYNTVGAQFDENVTPPGQLKNQLDNVRQIHVTLEMQSAEPIYNRASGSGRYVTSLWEKRFTPPNINL